MALKDRLNDALNTTPAENTRRLATLRAVLAAAGDGAGDPELQTAITKLIATREQQAASYSAAGQTELAKNEREEIDALRGILRTATVEAPPTPKKVKPAAAAPKPGAGSSTPLFSRTQTIIAGVVVVVLAVAAAVYYFGFSSDSSDATILASSDNAAISVLKTDRTLGSPTAPIKMLEYAAPTCPHCAHFAMDTFPLIKKNYIDTGKVFYIFRTFPLSATDGAAEAIARCLPADKYFQFIDLLFRNQSKWDPDGYQIADVHAALIQMARIMGMSAEKVDQCITDKDEQDRINQVAQDGETKYNIQGTPTFVINGTVVQAEEADWTQLKARLDSLLSKH